MLAVSLLVASFVIFAALYLAPGTPLAALSGGQPLPPGSAQVLEQRYHLNESFLAQYWYWLDNALHGNLGISITLRENVSTLIASRIWTTAGLVLYASLIIVVLGIGLGIVSGLRSGPLDTSVLVVTAVSAAIPAFVAAIALIMVFAVKLGWFPALGNGTSFLSNVRHFTLPAIALAGASLAIVARVTRAAVRAEGDREHVQTAVSRGIPARYVIQRHILRNAAIPITTITGITIASLIAVAAVVEVAFSLNGLGAYLVQAAESKDIAVVQGISLLLVTAFVVVNLLTDLICAALDPRLALQGQPPVSRVMAAAEASTSRRGLARLRATGPAGIASAAVIAVATFAAAFGPLLAPYDPDLPNLSLSWAGPAGGHLLGYDFEGRDVLSRLVAGAQSSMLGPLVVVILSVTAGTLLAVTAAWRRGVSDTAISSGLNIVFAFPGILLAVLAAAIFGAGLPAAAIALSIAYLPYVARVLRGAALKERGQPYVAALEVQGASATAICLRHVVPNIGPLIVAQATILFGYAMVDLAAISYLGLGVQPPTANWGVMISENKDGLLLGHPLPAVAAGLCIVIVVIAVNVLGERLFEQAQAARG